ncbi:MAG: type 4 prepilin-like protein leader peptide-processing enzyme [Pseudomonadota bacterium]|jgi:leader peptidase (prepilin peptidase)/N-methyltransferase
MTADVWFRATFALVGACLGSFLELVWSRSAQGRSVVHPPSACDACGVGLRPIDNVPVLSWLWLRGRCRACGAAIPAAHPLIEATSGGLAWLIAARFVPGPASLRLPEVATTVYITLFVGLWFWAALSDVRWRIIPDGASYLAVPVAVAGQVALEALGAADHVVGWKLSVLGAAAGWLGLGGLSLAWRLVRGREGLGWGDVRLAALIGAVLGPWPGLWGTLGIASALGAIAGLVSLLVLRRSSYLPLGPFLAVSATGIAIYGQAISRWWYGV